MRRWPVLFVHHGELRNVRDGYRRRPSSDTSRTPPSSSSSRREGPRSPMHLP
ncbi:hypothetical protein AURDEDRAFT_173125 [Auricularia subglabra TFB-10046 SS5]|nr:hypothetical protein AURDEDRAFT_173125 [Auricularia subglabra TFB-10046 SS5]